MLLLLLVMAAVVLFLLGAMILRRPACGAGDPGQECLECFQHRDQTPGTGL